MKTIESAGFKRGEVFYVRYDQSVGSEEAVGRPYIIISSDEGNESSPLLTVVPMTTSPRYTSTGVELTTPRRKSWALCNNIFSLDKSRFQDWMCTLTAAEMNKIDAAVAKVLGMSINEDRYSKQIEELKQAAEAAEKTAADSALEIEILKRAYERVLDKLVEQRIDADISKRQEVQKPEEFVSEADLSVENIPEIPVIEDIPEPPVPEPEIEEIPDVVDINRCTFKDLKKLNFSDNIAANIMANRPYMDVEDLRIVPGVTRVAFGLVEKKITVGDTAEFKPEKKKPEKKPQNEWSKPVTWETFKSYPREKQIECLNYFRETWSCGTAMMAEMFKCPRSTLSSYWTNHDMKGLLANNPDSEKKAVFVEWLASFEPKIPEPVESGEWDKIITWDEFKRYFPDKQVECLIHFEEKWNCNVVMMCEMFGTEEATVRKYFTRNNLNGILQKFPSSESVENFSKWLKNNGIDKKEAPVKKININLATQKELMDLGFSKPAAGKITMHIKRYGPYRDIEELKNTDEVPGKLLRKLKDRIEV